jgi:hypothetical protein
MKRTPGPISTALFANCMRRRVDEETDGRQYLVDGEEKIYSVWVALEEPVVTGGRE